MHTAINTLNTDEMMHKKNYNAPVPAIFIAALSTEGKKQQLNNKPNSAPQSRHKKSKNLRYLYPHS